MLRKEAIEEINKAFEPAFANYIITALTEDATVSDKESEQESCEGCVSRKDVIKAVDLHTFDTDNGLCLDDDISCIVENLPPVTPAQMESEDVVSRAEVISAFDKWIKSREDFAEHPVWFARSLASLPSVAPKCATVTEFADRCRECGARYGRYKDFCEFVAKMVLRDDFEENAGANAEFLCRKLSKLGIVKAEGENWLLAEMESEE